MAKLKIKKYVNKNTKNENAYGKTYGRIQHVDTLDTIDLAKHIQRHGSIFTRDVIVGVLEKFSMCIEELLQDGYKVKLNGLGTFYLSAKTKGEADGEDFDASNIEKVSIKFLADRSKDYDWGSDVQTLRSTFSIPGEKSESSASGSNSGSEGTNTNPTNGSNSGGTTTGGDEPGEDRP
jgi:predicted histone-like DNA-binding protein